LGEGGESLVACLAEVERLEGLGSGISPVPLEKGYRVVREMRSAPLHEAMKSLTLPLSFFAIVLIAIFIDLLV